MARSSKTGGNDLLQVVMMTFCMMAIFFAVWGAYNQYKCTKLRKLRAFENKSIHDLEILLNKPKSKEAMRDWLRREESKKLSTDVDVSVREVLDGLGASAPAIDRISGPRERNFGKGVVEHEWDLEFLKTDLKKLVAFVYKLELERPHINFKEIKLNRRATKKDKGQDLWSSDMKLATYTSKGE